MKDYKYIKFKNKFYECIPGQLECDKDCDLQKMCTTSEAMDGCYEDWKDEESCVLKQITQIPIGAAVWSYDENKAIVVVVDIKDKTCGSCRPCVYYGNCPFPDDRHCYVYNRKGYRASHFEVYKLG